MNHLAMITLGAALGLGAPLSLASATPAAGDAAPTVRVPYAPSELRSAAGAAAVEARLEQAARQVCSGFGNTSLAERAHAQACYARALDGAHKQIDLAPTYAAANRVSMAGH